MSKITGLMAGALAGSLLASALALFGSKDTAGKFTVLAKEEAAEILKGVRANVQKFGAESSSDRAKNHFTLGAVAGLLFGVGAALLLAPKTGRQMRKDLKESYNDIADITSETIHFISDNGHLPTQKAANALSSKRHAVKRAIK